MVDIIMMFTVLQFISRPAHLLVWSVLRNEIATKSAVYQWLAFSYYNYPLQYLTTEEQPVT